MSEPKPTWKYTLQDRDGDPLGDLDIPDEIEVEYTWNLGPIPELPQSFNPKGLQELQLNTMALAFAVPAELLRPHIGTIERVEREAAMATIRQTQELMADAFRPFIRAMDEYADTMARLALEMEQLRMKMIGRRYQAILAVLVVLVYLIVEVATR